MRFNDSKLANCPSIEWFIIHWKYWKNWEDSTILLDPGMNIIAFFDRETTNIDVIQTDIPYNWDKIYECLSDMDGKVKMVPHGIKENIRYKPKWYWAEIKRNADKIEELKKIVRKTRNKTKKEEEKKKIDYLKESIMDSVDEYNRDYFTNLKQDIWKQ